MGCLNTSIININGKLYSGEYKKKKKKKKKFCFTLFAKIACWGWLRGWTIGLPNLFTIVDYLALYLPDCLIWSWLRG